MLACVTFASSQPTVLPGQEAAEMEGVGVVQKLDDIVPGDLAFTLSCGDVSTTAFLAEYYSGNPMQLNKDKSASPIRGHGFSNFLGISTLLMIHAIY